MRGLQWDLFCHVVDNFGDIGVCWRLAADLAARGERVRLWLDDPSALRWMAPHGARGVEVRGWPSARPPAPGSDAFPAVCPDGPPREVPDEEAREVSGEIRREVPGDVVIEAFGCTLPEAFVQRMASAAHPPLWINLEYLSAEDFVVRAHRLASPQTSGPGAGLRKHFFYPGFTTGTGGLLREADWRSRRGAFDAPAWLAANGATPTPGERVVSLFCYEQPALAALIEQLAVTPTLLLATAGHAARQVEALLGPALQRGALRALPLPALTQVDYDHLLWASDLNFVRGEDSFVRAQWAAKPFVWQIYPQHDGVHLDKLGAFLDRFGADDPQRSFWQAWHVASMPLPALPALLAWQRHCEAWRDSLWALPDLTTQLIGFASESR